MPLSVQPHQGHSSPTNSSRAWRLRSRTKFIGSGRLKRLGAGTKFAPAKFSLFRESKRSRKFGTWSVDDLRFSFRSPIGIPSTRDFTGSSTEVIRKNQKQFN